MIIKVLTNFSNDLVLFLVSRGLMRSHSIKILPVYNAVVVSGIGQESLADI